MKTNLFSYSQSDESYKLTKPALIFVAGKHKDNVGRVHQFDDNFLTNLAKNSNKRLETGGRIPFQEDHKKGQKANLGDVVGQFETKLITPDLLPNKKAKHLVGKLGLFVSGIEGKGEEVVEQMKNKSISTLSPGIDPVTKTIAEVSATPFPAIPGLSLFNQYGNEDEEDTIYYLEYQAESTGEIKPADMTPSKEGPVKAVSFKDLYEAKAGMEIIEQKYQKLSRDLYLILTSLSSMSEEELATKGVSSPIDSSYEAIEYFIEQLEEFFNLVEKDEEHEVLEPGASTKEDITRKRAQDGAPGSKTLPGTKFARSSDHILIFNINKKKK